MSASGPTPSSTSFRSLWRIVALGMAGAWFALATPALALGRTNIAEKIARALTPLSLRYACDDPPLLAAEDSFKLVLEFARPGDRIVLMAFNGDYGLFSVNNAASAVPEFIPKQQLRTQFAGITGTLYRVWVILADATPGVPVAPPAAYAAQINEAFTPLPLPLPTYYADRTQPRGSTNYWLNHAALLEKIAARKPQGITAKFCVDLARVYRQYGLASNAVATYLRGLDSFPDDPYLHRGLADCYFSVYSNCQASIEHNRRASYAFRRQQGMPLYEALFGIAMAYQQQGDVDKARLQYSDILSQIDEYPDAAWESRTRRYLGNLFASLGDTNNAVRQFRIDVSRTQQSPVYSYDKLLNLVGKKDYNDIAREYFNRCGTNEASALLPHLRVLVREGGVVPLSNAVSLAQGWLRAQPTLRTSLRANAAWWGMWSNAAVRSGLSPEP